MEKIMGKSLFQMGKIIQLDWKRLRKLEAGILPGAPNVSDATTLSETIDAIKGRIKKRMNEYLKEYSRLYDWIDQVDAPYAKQLFTMLYVEGVSAADIALKMGMTPLTIRSDIYRYRKKYDVQWKAKHPRMDYTDKTPIPNC